MLRARNYSNLAKRYLTTFPVLCLIGPRQAGKTTFAKELVKNDGWKYFDLEQPADFQLISNAPELFFEQYNNKIIIDEAQEFLPLFKILRGVIDADRNKKGRFIVTGSSSPEINAHLSDSLAGRVGTIAILGFKANEFFQTPLSSFYEIFAQPHSIASLKNLVLDNPKLSNKQMRHCWLYGGYPEALSYAQENLTAYYDWMKNYHATYINRDIARLFPRLNKLAYQRFISTLSSLSGTILNKADLARAIEIGEKSIREYLQIAEQTFIWRNIPYDSTSSVKSLVKRPKGFLTDSGLQHFLQKITDYEQLIRHPTCGHSFESFVIEEIIKGIISAGIAHADFSYYRTNKGAEVDLIVNSAAGKIPIEIKMAKSVSPKQLLGLSKYIDDNHLAFGLVINQSDHPIWLSKNILQVPLCHL